MGRHAKATVLKLSEGLDVVVHGDADGYQIDGWKIRQGHSDLIPEKVPATPGDDLLAKHFRSLEEVISAVLRANRRALR